MKSIFVLGSIVIAASSLQTRKSHESKDLKHQWTDDCCTAQRGYPCGTVVSKCCTKGCKKSWFGDKCVNGEQFQPVCQSCSQTCTSLGGIPCQISLDTKEIQCCPSASCKITSHNVFNQAKNKIVGLTSSDDDQTPKQHKFLDTIYNSVGEQRKCEDGSLINLGNCVKNTKWELTKLKLLAD